MACHGLVDPEQPVNVVWLMLWTAVGAVITWWVLRTALTLIKDMRELRRQEELRKSERQQKEMAVKLREQERRIDDKISKAITEEVPSGD